MEEKYDTLVEWQYDTTIKEGQYDTIRVLESYPWYAGMKSRLEANRDLHKSKDGTFLVRNSNTHPGKYAISIK